MIVKVRATVLNVIPVSETSRVVTWMTDRHGKLSTMLKGAQRPKSWFLGQYDLFYTCQLLYYPRPRTGLHIARECSPLETRSPLRKDWRACAIASYVASSVSQVSQPDSPQLELSDLLEHTLNHLVRTGASWNIVFWFELHLLRVQGVAPRLRHCVDCDRAVPPTERQVTFSTARGGILCRACSTRSRQDYGALRPDVRALMAALQEARTPGSAMTLKSNRLQEEFLDDLLGKFLAYHLDTSLAARRAALAILAFPPPGAQKDLEPRAHNRLR